MLRTLLKDARGSLFVGCGVVRAAHVPRIPLPFIAHRNNTMRNTAFAFALISTLFIGGCATKPAGSSGSSAPPPAAAAEPAPRVATPVNVPAVSARKVVMSMTGPKQVIEAKDWADFKREWSATFSEYAKAAGIAFSFVDGDLVPQGQDGTMLLVSVSDYRMVGIGARIMFGIMTGNAFIDANIKFANLRDGAVFGEQQYNTSSSAWGGIFAKVTPQQVDTIGSEVFRDIKAAK